MALQSQQQPDVSISNRIDELDYLKCIMIILMISFHLVYIGDSYPYAKQVVYTFHMPVFLIVSGYLMNIRKEPWQFLKMIFWLAIPYFIMESGYIVMASILPIREHIDQLTLNVFLEKLLINPLGPYWYLQTLIICDLTYYAVFRLVKAHLLTLYIIIGILYALYAQLELLSFSLALYFLSGAIIRHSTLNFQQVFRPSLLAFLAAGLLMAFPENLQAETAGGILIVYLVISSCLAVYPWIKGKIREWMLFIGRNTLPLFLFSPIFTILCKHLVEPLQFDPTGMLFLILSLMICISGSLAICWLMDCCGISPYFFGHPYFPKSAQKQ